MNLASEPSNATDQLQLALSNNTPWQIASPLRLAVMNGCKMSIVPSAINRRAYSSMLIMSQTAILDKFSGTLQLSPHRHD